MGHVWPTLEKAEPYVACFHVHRSNLLIYIMDAFAGEPFLTLFARKPFAARSIARLNRDPFAGGEGVAFSRKDKLPK